MGAVLAGCRYAWACAVEWASIRLYYRTDTLHRWAENFEGDAIEARDRLRPEWWPRWVVMHERPGVQHFAYGVRDRRDAFAHAERFSKASSYEAMGVRERVPGVRARVVRYGIGAGPRGKVLATFEPGTIPSGTVELPSADSGR